MLPHFLGDEAKELVRVPTAGDGTVDLWVVSREELRRVPRVREVITFLAELVRENQPRLCRNE